MMSDYGRAAFAFFCGALLFAAAMAALMLVTACSALVAVKVLP